MSGRIARTIIVSCDTPSTTTFFVRIPFTFHEAAIRCVRFCVACVYVRCQSDFPVGVSSVVGVCWVSGSVWGFMSVSSGSVRLVVALNQLVIGLVLSGGLCRLGRFLGWFVLGAGLRVVFWGRAVLSCSCVVSVVCVLICGWVRCRFGGGGVREVVVSPSRVSSRDWSVRCVPLRDVTSDPSLILVKLVPQVPIQDVRCAGCVLLYIIPLSLSLIRRTPDSSLSVLLPYWSLRSCTFSASMPSLMTSVTLLLPSRPELTCCTQRDATQATQTPQLKPSVCRKVLLSISEYPAKALCMSRTSVREKLSPLGSSNTTCLSM
mmetsp:Transcript_29831/g.50116  ORF Transcript_29831/g.50116 Transcript_29831/m.50116 type:complete len:319 (-) Transcript_29831:419-1375(-)